MSENVLDVRIKSRYDTEENWQQTNPVLLKGEVAYSSDKNNQYKQGNGTARWSELPYAKAAPLEHGHTKSQISDFPTALKNPNALSINGKTYDGSSAQNVGTIGVAYGGTGQTTAKDSANTLLNGLGVGDTAPADNTNIIVQGVGSYASKFYKKPASLLWNYIKGKADSIYAKLSHTHTSVNDSGNGAATTFAYSKAGLGTTSWVAAWNGYELRAIAPSTLRTVMGAASSSHGKHVPDTCTTITDWNNATTTGWYMGYQTANAPNSAYNWYFGRVIAHTTNYLYQEVYQFTASTDAKAIPKYIRARTNGTWGDWTNVTVAKAVPADAKFTDTNTWRGIKNNLTSDSTTDSLSAAQGKALKTLVDGKASTSHTHTKAQITTALGYTPYTPNEVDNKFSTFETNIDWKESVPTYADIATTYPNPVDGWTVNVDDTDYTYRYNGTSWVAISANAIPKATNGVDGLLTKEDHAKYEDANSKKHTHSNKSVIDGITSEHVTKWNSSLADAKSYTDSAVDGIEIGGRNLLTGTKDFSGTHMGKTTQYFVHDDSLYNGMTVLKGTFPPFDPNSQSYSYKDWCHYKQSEAVSLNRMMKKDETVTVSFWAKASKAVVVRMHWCNMGAKSTAIVDGTIQRTTSDGLAQVNINTEWDRHTITWKLATDQASLNGLFVLARLYTSAGDGTGGDNVYFAGYKMEIGNKATDWTPAPEDFETPINELQTDLEGKVNKDNAYLLKTFSIIPENADLNTYTTPGVYCQVQSNIAATITNKPYSTSPHEFKLIVEYFFNNNSTYIMQRLYRWNSCDVYLRESTNGGTTWKAWEKLSVDGHTHNYAGSSSPGGVANSATKLQTPRSIAISGGATGTATNFDGSSNISIPVTNIKEAYLSWGGKNFAGTYGCIDAAMIPELGANRLAFMPAAGVEIQYSRDGGATWVDYPDSDTGKINLFNGKGSGYCIGGSLDKKIDKSKYQLRVIITTDIARVYTVLKKFCIYCSTGGSSGCWCTIDAKTKANVDSGTDTWVTFANKVSINGWSGYNIINISGVETYGNQDNQYQKVRFTFGVTSHSSAINYSGLTIMKIMGFGGMGWITPSTMASTGRMYTYDAGKNVTFPAKVTASTFAGSLSGNASSASSVPWSGVTGKPSTFAPSSHTHSYAGSSSAGGSATSAVKLDSSAGSATQPVYFSGGKPVACTHTLGKSVPADAKFTDTTYSDFSGANSHANGTHGLVPAPLAEDASSGAFLSATGDWSVPTDTTYSDATTSTSGLMSASDKAKLNGIASNANAYSLPTASSSTLGGVKTTSTVTSTSGLTACPIVSGVPYYKGTNVVNNLTTTNAGYALDARQGKELNDRYDEVCHDIATLVGINGPNGKALRFFEPSDTDTNLTTGYFQEGGLYMYPGNLAGAPSTYAGLLLVVRTPSSGSYLKIAFGFDCKIYMQRQSSDGTVTQKWVEK